MGKNIYYLAKNGREKGYIGCFSSERGYGANARACRFVSAAFDFDRPFDEKIIYSVSLSAKIESGTQCKLKLYYDGVLSPMEYTLALSGEAETYPYKIRLSQKKCRDFAFEIESSGGNIELYGAEIEYV